MVLTNCSNNYGPYHFPEKLIPVVILNALAGKPLPIYGDGSNIRDWLYVEDHADALLLVVAAMTAWRSFDPETGEYVFLSAYNLENLFDDKDDPALSGEYDDINEKTSEARSDASQKTADARKDAAVDRLVDERAHLAIADQPQIKRGHRPLSPAAASHFNVVSTFSSP